MKYKFLGKSGIRISELVMGAMTFGNECDKKTSFTLLDKFESEGGNTIDTANVYSNGNSESIVGEWLKSRDRDDFIIATKVRFPMGAQPNNAGISTKHIRSSLKKSLERLQTDYIDLYQIHAWDMYTPLEESLYTLSDLVDKGLVNYIGVSNFKGWQLQKAIDISEKYGFRKIISIQPQYNLLERGIEYEIKDVVEENGLGVISWSPLRGGWLTGKFKQNVKPIGTNTRVERSSAIDPGEAWERYNNDRTWEIIKKEEDIANRRGVTVSQVSINWVRSHKWITAPIIGARNLEQLKDNLSSLNWELDNNEIEELNHVSMMKNFYPYDFIEWAVKRR
ncbi:aldo/keto reductase [Picrophilus oshimae]|uniref:Predicted oxidoreductase n=1 Tax=Picrophilus torridus (strain ATCC 700027 / DSM 9790 / JCM 10055 / NBRC 100828 / KAW 2/3) TaxID=1122961 RepID=A0A8G2FXU5_PICTO|nr:aldo/keto reductase [Picrophilus oshimae]SMD31413.1 Predicted oxidoreductase [Picrophilus oshimae DSM 9789]